MADTINWAQKKTDWEKLVSSLIEEISLWCDDLGWTAIRSIKQITEEYIGSYELPCLTIQAPSGRIHIDPMGTNIIGAQGRVDILAYPTLNRLLLVRRDDRWVLFTDARVPWPKKWGKKAFSEVIKSLAA